jgi:hypothetical protein
MSSLRTSQPLPTFRTVQKPKEEDEFIYALRTYNKPRLEFILVNEIKRHDKKRKYALQALQESAKRLDEDFFQKLVNLGLVTGLDVTNALILANQFEAADNFIAGGFPPTVETEIEAAKNLNLPAIEYLARVSFDVAPSEYGATEAVLAQPQSVGKTLEDQYAVLDWYAAHDTRPTAQVKVEKLSDPSLLDWMDQHDLVYQVDDKTFDVLMNGYKHGAIQFLKAILDRGYLPGARSLAVQSAFVLDRADAIQLLHEYGYRFKPNDIQTAKPSTKKYLTSQGY